MTRANSAPERAVHSTADNANVALLLDTQLAQHGSAVAIIDPASDIESVTFAALNLMALGMQQQLRHSGVSAGDHALFFAPPSAAMYAALIAVWRLGAVATFVEPSAGTAVLTAACTMCTPRALIASPKAHLLRLTSKGLRSIPVKFAINGWAPFTHTLDVRATAASDETANVNEHAPALLTFTSGSTGVPKGAIRTHGVLRAQLSALTAAFVAHPKQCELVALPIVVLLNLANGVTTVLPSADLRKPGSIAAAPVLEQLREHGVTSMVAAPAFLERLVTHADAYEAFGAIDTVITGGGPVFPDLVARVSKVAPNASVISVYGSTEAEPIAHVADADVSAADMDLMQHGGGLLAGAPVSDVQLKLVRISHQDITVTDQHDFDELAVAHGAVGEIIVTGDHVVKGYWGGIGDSETKIRVGNTVWHRTGDLGRLDAAGRLWLLGRLDAYANDNRGAFYPFAVECAARTIPGVHRAAAFAFNGRRILAIAGGDGTALNANTVREHLRWAQLDDVRIVTALPMDKRHNSKVNYAALRKQLGMN